MEPVKSGQGKWYPVGDFWGLGCLITSSCPSQAWGKERSLGCFWAPGPFGDADKGSLSLGKGGALVRGRRAGFPSSLPLPCPVCRSGTLHGGPESICEVKDNHACPHLWGWTSNRGESPAPRTLPRPHQTFK